MERGGFGSAKLPSADLEKNIHYLREDVFSDDDTMRFRRLTNRHRPELKFCLIYADGMINNKIINDDIVCPLVAYQFPKDTGDDLAEYLMDCVVTSNDAEKTPEMENIVQAAVYGDTVLLTEGCSDALLFSTKAFPTRAISEPESERVLRGPREGFNESLLMNVSMIRRRLRTPDLKLRLLTFGRRTRTKACLCYLGGVVDRAVLREMERRLSKIDIDGVLDTEYLIELIRDKRWACLDTIGTTERPDVVAAKLLEGRVALLLDGTPQAITAPYLFIESFQSDEDYYLNFYFASIGRVLRMLAFYMSSMLPAAYIALVDYHPEVLPTPLLVSFIQARQGVPFPTVLEMLFMLFVFEMLRESGARMPGLMGQTLSIVGALVIGQATVQAKLISAPIIVIVALAGITGLMNPKIKGFTIAVRLLMLALVTALGLYGFLYGNLALLILLFNLTSFGVPLMSNDSDRREKRQDTLFRDPWWKMIRRPEELSKNRIRQKRDGGGR